MTTAAVVLLVLAALAVLFLITMGVLALWNCAASLDQLKRATEWYVGREMDRDAEADQLRRRVEE